LNEKRLETAVDLGCLEETRGLMRKIEVFTAVSKKDVVFGDVTPCGSCKNRRFGGTHHLHHQGEKNQ
jgi:hypothetical protein